MSPGGFAVADDSRIQVLCRSIPTPGRTSSGWAECPVPGPADTARRTEG